MGAQVQLLPFTPHRLLLCHHPPASLFPTGFLSATLHSQFSPLGAHVLGDRCCFQCLGGCTRGCSGCSDSMVTNITMMGAIEFSKVIPPLRERRSRLELSNRALTLAKEKVELKEVFAMERGCYMELRFRLMPHVLHPIHICSRFCDIVMFNCH